jgi:hypothetical protein
VEAKVWEHTTSGGWEGDVYVASVVVGSVFWGSAFWGGNGEAAGRGKEE